MRPFLISQRKLAIQCLDYLRSKRSSSALLWGFLDVYFDVFIYLVPTYEMVTVHLFSS